jgi:hypothetical protein
LDDERRKLVLQNQKLEELNQEKHLLEREMLLKKVTELTEKTKDAEGKLEEETKKFQLSCQNLGNDNRQLRGKIHSMEKEILLLRDRTVTLDDVIREKDKSIASLSIYRYNAIHRKVESICKTCLKREKAESETKRKAHILEKLPIVHSPSMSLASSTSVIVSVTVPSKKSKINGNTVEYSRLALVYSDDPSMETNTHKVLIDLESVEGSNSTAGNTTLSRKVTLASKQSSFVEGENTAEDTKEELSFEEKLIVKKVKVTNLETGKFYFFQVVAGQLDVDGPPSKTESIFVDGLPHAPSQPLLQISLKPAFINISLDQATCTGSPIISYRLYHCSQTDRKDAFLINEMKKEQLLQVLEGEKIKFSLENPELRIPHYFKVSAVNLMGEGPCSEWSEAGLIGAHFLLKFIFFKKT